MYRGLHEGTRYSCEMLNETLTSSTDFQKKILGISNFMKIHLVGAELLHADGRTDRHDEADGFRNFANAPKNHSKAYVCSRIHSALTIC
jgi:hypothetical protein